MQLVLIDAVAPLLPAKRSASVLASALPRRCTGALAAEAVGEVLLLEDA